VNPFGEEPGPHTSGSLRVAAGALSARHTSAHATNVGRRGDVFASENTDYLRLARMPTVPGARTSLFVPQRDRLYLVARADRMSRGEPSPRWAPATAVWCWCNSAQTYRPFDGTSICDIALSKQKGRRNSRPCLKSSSYLVGQIFQTTPVPGICTKGPLLAPTKCESEPRSRTAP
jgi:hypothetical protein